MIFRLVMLHWHKIVSEYAEKHKGRGPTRLALDPECLRWTPLISLQALEEEEELAEKEVRLKSYQCMIERCSKLLFLCL